MLTSKRLVATGVTAVAVFGLAGFVGATALVPTSELPALSPEAYEPDAAGATTRIATPDPSAGRPWGVRVYRSKTGLTCSQAGRLLGRFQEGEFGQVDPGDGKFHAQRPSEASFGRVDPDTGKFDELPEGATGTCTDLDKAPSSIVVSNYPAEGQRGARAVIFGVLTPAVATVRLDVQGEPRRLDFNADSYVAVIDLGEVGAAVLTFTMKDATVKRVQLLPRTPPPIQPPAE